MSADPAIQEEYLLEFLRDEFRDYDEVRIRPVVDEHERGVSCKTESREYFFPFEWAQEPGFKKVRALISKVKEAVDPFGTRSP